LRQRPDEGSHRPSVVSRQDTRDVFPDDPARAKNVDQSAELQREVASVAIDPCSQSCKGEVLAWRTSDEKVDVEGSNRVRWLM
jgi:hypothetical protein